MPTGSPVLAMQDERLKPCGRIITSKRPHSSLDYLPPAEFVRVRAKTRA